MHPHQDMEIVTFMVAGGMRHEDSTGGKGRIGEGEIQRMSAGTALSILNIIRGRPRSAIPCKYGSGPPRSGSSRATSRCLSMAPAPG